ncbi:hypothetical protein [Schinkia azotoformans]|uniref:hypothetical protein n=1 Tax=Schinkia azotoformans TaxID=1454 RepID=UPI002DB74D25|nr:hypothetical protein [Schinkia azotoformans]MEC1718920.1 hypothetical protein [Schinkia azotoformans]MED4412868.1 hypothetical protein [Schinkia azotoformans]
MVIQTNMSPKAIVEVWENTTTIFEKHNIPLVDKSLETFVGIIELTILLKELNEIVGSSSATCVEGG